MRGQSGGKVKKKVGSLKIFKWYEGPIPALLKALEQVDPILALSKALGQASFHKGTERPVRALLKALGQAPPFPYGERAIPALLKVLGQVILIPL